MNMQNLFTRLAATVLALALAGCNAVVPSDGPLERKVIKDAEVIGMTEAEATYGLIDLDVKSVKAVDDFHLISPFNETFGLGGPSGIRIGVGDTVTITIFEAGPDGLFSTTEQKQIVLPLIVQNDGRISVPYAGTIQAAGRTSEQVRGSILGVLRERAVEPDVIVSLTGSVSRSVTVTGAVNGSAIVPLVAGDERVLDVIAAAGGPTQPAYETFVTIQRNGRSCTVLLQTLVDKPHENIYVRPDDTIFLSYDPRTFAAFGAVGQKGNLEFDTARLSLAEAAAIAQGVDEDRANPEGYFVFRFESIAVLKQLAHLHIITQEELHALLADEHSRDQRNRVPIVYRLDLSEPEAFFVAKRFAMRDKDVIYVARSFGVDLARFITLIDSVAATTLRITN